MQTTLAQTDPKRIPCFHCLAPIGAWCRTSRRHGSGDRWFTDEGFIHRKRARAAFRFRVLGRTPPGQLALFEGAR